MTPYYSDDLVTLYLGDCREILPALGLKADCVIADPPWEETSLPWDKWPLGWLGTVAGVTRSMWCIGSLRLFMNHVDEFEDARWRLSQDLIWEKPNGTGFASDRFKRVHEQAAHFYRGPWGTVHHEVPRTPYCGPDKHVRRRFASRGPHVGEIGHKTYEDDGTRLARSVQFFKSVRGGLHRTQKPVPLLEMMISYSCPPGGLVIDPFGGSCSTLFAARASGRCGVAIEADEAACAKAARWLSEPVQPDLFGGAA